MLVLLQCLAQHRAALPDQPPILNIILGSEVNDHRGAKLVDALEDRVKAALF